MNNRWRTIDIVIASIIAVAFGVIFWAWNALWGATTAAFATRWGCLLVLLVPT